MTHIRTICAIAMVALSTAAMTNIAYAASPSHSKSTNASKHANPNATTSNRSAVAGQTDIVANVDMPMVTNILPWQEKEGSLPKNILEFSALKDSLIPTDRDRLAGEIRYTSILNQPVDQK